MITDGCGCYGRALRWSVLADGLTQRLRLRSAVPERPQRRAGPGAAMLRQPDASVLLRTLGRRSSQLNRRR